MNSKEDFLREDLPKRAKTFVLWNNKGGVGKSTLTFNIVCEYAYQFPDRNFLVLDMCPQANSSAFFFGGGSKGPRRVERICRPNGPNSPTPDAESPESDPKTVAALIARSLDKNFKVLKSDEEYYRTFLHRARDYSKSVPPNIFVVCGDAILDVLAPRLEDHCRRSFVMSGNESTFAATHKFLRRFIDVITNKRPETWVVFVDTNPAFTIYTRMALCAADQLVVPCNPDEFSVNAIRSLTQLLYGAKLQAPYVMNTFYTEAQEHKLKIPRLRLVIANRFVSKENKSGPRLYQAMQSKLSRYFMNVMKELDYEFLEPVKVRVGDRDIELRASTVAENGFMKYYVSPVPLFHTAGILSSVEGLPFTNIHQGTYTVEGQKGNVTLGPLISGGWAIQDIVLHLECGQTGYSGRSCEMAAIIEKGKFEERKLVRIRIMPTYKQRDLGCIEHVRSVSGRAVVSIGDVDDELFSEPGELEDERDFDSVDEEDALAELPNDDDEEISLEVQEEDEVRNAAAKAKRKIADISEPGETEKNKPYRHPVDSVSKLIEKAPDCKRRKVHVSPENRDYCLECLDGGEELCVCDHCVEPWHRHCVTASCFSGPEDSQAFICPLCKGDKDANEPGLKVIAATYQLTEGDYGAGVTWTVRQAGKVRNSQLTEEAMKEIGFRARIEWLSNNEIHQL